VYVEMLIKSIDLGNKEYDCVISFKTGTVFMGIVKGSISFDSIVEFIEGIKLSGYGLSAYLKQDDLKATTDIFGYNIFKFR